MAVGHGDGGSGSDGLGREECGTAQGIQRPDFLIPCSKRSDGWWPAWCQPRSTAARSGQRNRCGTPARAPGRAGSPCAGGLQLPSAVAWKYTVIDTVPAGTWQRTAQPHAGEEHISQCGQRHRSRSAAGGVSRIHSCVRLLVAAGRPRCAGNEASDGAHLIAVEPFHGAQGGDRFEPFALQAEARLRHGHIAHAPGLAAHGRDGGGRGGDHLRAVAHRPAGSTALQCWVERLVRTGVACTVNAPAVKAPGIVDSERQRIAQPVGVLQDGAAAAWQR